MRKGILVLLALLIVTTSTPLVSYSTVPVSSTPVSGQSSEPDPTTVRAAIKEFMGLSKKEKKARFKQIKKEIKAFKAKKKKGEDPSVSTILLCILAILLPPLAVYLHQGEFNAKFWISVLLCLLAIITFFLWIIPVVFALLVVLNLI